MLALALGEGHSQDMPPGGPEARGLLHPEDQVPLGLEGPGPEPSLASSGNHCGPRVVGTVLGPPKFTDPAPGRCWDYTGERTAWSPAALRTRCSMGGRERALPAGPPSRGGQHPLWVGR